MSLWENEDTAREYRLQRILIITAGVVAAGTVLLAARVVAVRIMHPSNGIGFTNVERERRLINADPLEPDGARPATAWSAPGYAAHPFVRRPVGSQTGFGTGLRAPGPPATIVAADVSPLSQAEREQAATALAPLRDAYLAVREYDRHSFWHAGAFGAGAATSRPVQIGPYATAREMNALPRPGAPLTNESAAALAAGSGDFAPGGGVGIPGPGSDASSGGASGFGGGTASRGAQYGAGDSAASPMNEPAGYSVRGYAAAGAYAPTSTYTNSSGTGSEQSVQSVDDATSALSALVSLYGHPDRFPAPVRSDVGAAAKAMHDYLKITMDVAASGDSRAIAAYQPAAAQRLAESDAALRRAEQTVYNPTSMGSPTGIAR